MIGCHRLISQSGASFWGRGAGHNLFSFFFHCTTCFFYQSTRLKKDSRVKIRDLQNTDRNGRPARGRFLGARVDFYWRIIGGPYKSIMIDRLSLRQIQNDGVPFFLFRPESWRAKKTNEMNRFALNAAINRYVPRSETSWPHQSRFLPRSWNQKKKQYRNDFLFPVD